MMLKMFMNCEIYHQKRRRQIQKKAVNHKLILSAAADKTAFHSYFWGEYCGSVRIRWPGIFSYALNFRHILLQNRKIIPFPAG
ncbi:MAG TPA: hypothetical protein DCG73_09665 [Morganella sp. (in: Bacteria)]|nr:hypothetical protein [Morganella sp. (in: enterobacteria)]